MTDIPEDLVWNPDFPPVVFRCSGMMNIHADGCDGSCGVVKMDEDDVKLTNEYRAWARLGMTAVAYPEGVPQIPGTKGFGIGLLELSTRVDALIETLMRGIPEFAEHFPAQYKRSLYQRLWSVRMDNQDSVLERRRAQLVGAITSPKVLLGPTGERIL